MRRAHLGFVRRRQFERGRAVLDGVRVNAGYGRNIGGFGGADGDGHAAYRKASKTKRPGTRPGR